MALKLSIVKQSVKEENKDIEIEFYLEETDLGGIFLKARNKNTNKSCYLISFTKNGLFYLEGSIPLDFGLPLDQYRRIKKLGD